MGNTDSKPVLKQGIFRLSSPEPIAPNDSYWRSFFELPSSPDDIFSLFTSADIRRARDSAPKNIENLVRVLVSRLSALRSHRSFPQPDTAPERHALNCIRVLTRILPFIYEDDRLDGWEEAVFWEKRRRRKKGGRAEVLFDDSTEDQERPEEEYEDVRPLGEELIDTLVDLLFFAGFTVAPTDRSKNKVTYAIWQLGVGCTTVMNATREMESNRVEILRLLITLSSKSLYLPAHLLPVKGVKALTYITTCPDKQLVLSLLCSQMNTALAYNPTNWRVPYDHVVYQDPKQLLVTYSLQFLLLILLYPIPENAKGYTPKNTFRHFLGRLHRLQDFEFLAEGMTKTLNQPVCACNLDSRVTFSQSLVAGNVFVSARKPEDFELDLRNGYALLGDPTIGHDFMILMLFYSLDYRSNPTKQGVVRMCVFVLQTLSTETNFGKLLNRELKEQESFPAAIRIPEFKGSYGDFLIIAIHNLITSSKGKLDAIYPSLLATINNVAPYLEHLSTQACSKLLQLYASISSPSFLLANETNHALLQSLLDSINALLEHQYSKNRILVQGIFKYRKHFEGLRSFTLESGKEEIERLNQSKKEAATSSDPASPVYHSRNSSIDSLRNLQSARSPSLSDVPEDTAFAIGEDDDSDNDTQITPPTSPRSSPSTRNSRAASISSVGEPLPQQIRGMSEKARGKMPAGQPSFSRQNSATSLPTNQLSSITSPTLQGGFAPAPGWIDTWLPTLPLHTILTLLSYPSPPNTLPATIDPAPPRAHFFEWTPLSLGWYESLLWGLVFTAEMVVQKGTVGVWNGTGVRLFRVQQEQARGPSLMKPMGAVDAVGSRIVSGIGSLNLRGAVGTAGASREGDGERRLPSRSVRDV